MAHDIIQTVNFLRERMSAYTTPFLVNASAKEFQHKIEGLIDTVDSDVEGYIDPAVQRDLSIRFHWGHNHNFGDFSVQGRMGDRHLKIPAHFHNFFDAFPLDLKGKRVLDIGSWTGGMGMVFLALGAEVVSLEEVKKYADACRYLRDSFEIEKWRIESTSLYALDTLGLDDYFDYVLYLGVLYHVTDLVLSLRHCFNVLKDGGTILVETQAIPTDQPLIKYEGARVVFSGSQENLDRSGWNWFVPSPTALQQMIVDVGFENVKYHMTPGNNCFAIAQRVMHKDMLRAGLARPGIR